MELWVLTLFTFLLTSLLVGSSAEQCGNQAGGALCPGGLCCSKYGWCGTTPEYCGLDCQSQCNSGARGDGVGVNEQCGNQAGGAVCPGGLCCSKYGWCGSTPEYCGLDCQSQCNSDARGVGVNEQCGNQAGGALCPGGLCCSKYGWCGSSPEYCGLDCQSQCNSGASGDGVGDIKIRNIIFKK